MDDIERETLVVRAAVDLASRALVGKNVQADSAWPGSAAIAAASVKIAEQIVGVVEAEAGKLGVVSFDADRWAFVLGRVQAAVVVAKRLRAGMAVAPEQVPLLDAILEGLTACLPPMPISTIPYMKPALPDDEAPYTFNLGEVDGPGVRVESGDRGLASLLNTAWTLGRQSITSMKAPAPDSFERLVRLVAVEAAVRKVDLLALQFDLQPADGKTQRVRIQLAANDLAILQQAYGDDGLPNAAEWASKVVTGEYPPQPSIIQMAQKVISGQEVKALDVAADDGMEPK